MGGKTGYYFLFQKDWRESPFDKNEMENVDMKRGGLGFERSQALKCLLMYSYKEFGSWTACCWIPALELIQDWTETEVSPHVFYSKSSTMSLSYRKPIRHFIDKLIQLTSSIDGDGHLTLFSRKSQLLIPHSLSEDTQHILIWCLT